MPCCGLCRAKKKPTNTANKNLSGKKINTIEMWIENIEGPYEPIVLPSKPADKPITTTNKDEIAELRRDKANAHGNKRTLSSEPSSNADLDSEQSESNR